MTKRLDTGICPECGGEMEEGAYCHNSECTIGQLNNEMDRGDILYHEQADREAMEHFEGRE
jgi:hypothetical protein